MDPAPPAARRQTLNADLAERAFRKGSGLAIHRPVHVYLQIASACNIDCYMCTEHNRPPHLRRGHGLRSLSPGIFEKIEREVLPWSTRLSFGVGGEPTISEHFLDYLARGARLGQEIHLTTNGTRIEREEVADAIARHVQRLQISIDAATPATYERIRFGARWTSLRRGLELLQRKRAELGAQNRCHLSLTFVLMRSNVDELPDFVELAHAVGADAVWAQHVIPATEDARDEPLIREPERYNRVLERTRARARALGIPLNAPLPFPLQGAPAECAPEAPQPSEPARVVPLTDHAIPCRLPTQSLFVLYDGRVFPCCHPFAHQKMQVGDLSRESFAEIWNRTLYRNLRVGLRSGDAPQICRSCSLAHDPPPAYEDPQLLLAGPQLGAYYGERDLEPLDGIDPLAWMIQAGWMGWADDVQAHAQTLEGERTHMAGHIANLAAERTHMAGHIANLAAERKHLVGHIANLERQQAELSERARSLRGFKGAVRFVRQALTGPLVRSSLGLNGKQAPESAREEA
jgi:radical SAM protein with 4Fe4S-binding SPASM domain